MVERLENTIEEPKVAVYAVPSHISAGGVSIF